MITEREMELLARDSYFTSIIRTEDGRLIGAGVRNRVSFSKLIHEPIGKEDAYMIGDLPIPAIARTHGPAAEPKLGNWDLI